MFIERKSSYKAPPVTTTDKLISQESRRSKALEEQKRRRAQKVNSCRQLDLFADLNLGTSDDEGDIELCGKTGPDGVAKFASLLPQDIETSAAGLEPDRKQSKKKGKCKRGVRKCGQSTQWADKCMYAELLEMKDVDSWSAPIGGVMNDGLPEDIETGWVAVAPVPMGKRCLAVTYQSSEFAAPNTTLRSRVLGKSLIPPFPSPLPPLTILDCILDSSWRENGILHVLDVLQYRGQDVGDCETAFRFWWRDTRLAELPRFSPLSNGHLPMRQQQGNSTNVSLSPSVRQDRPSPSHYRFPYPNTLLPVPYHTNTSLRYLSSHVIPLARSSRLVSIDIPSSVAEVSSGVEAGMDVDTVGGLQSSNSFTSQLTSTPVSIGADGLLLYVTLASYEPGTSPLSSWIPVKGDDADSSSALDLFERLVNRRMDAIQHNTNLRDMDVRRDE